MRGLTFWLGSVGYERMKNARITPKLALEGEVKIRRV